MSKQPMPNRVRVKPEPCPVYFEGRDQVVQSENRDRRHRFFHCIQSVPLCAVGCRQRAAVFRSEGTPVDWAYWRQQRPLFLRVRHSLMDAVVAVYRLEQMWGAVFDPLIDHLKSRRLLERDLRDNPFPGIYHLEPKQGPINTSFVVGAWYYNFDQNMVSNEVALVYIENVTKDHTKSPMVTVRHILQTAVLSKDPGYATRVLKSSTEYTCALHMRAPSTLDPGTKACMCCHKGVAPAHEYFLVGMPGNWIPICALNRVQAGGVCWE